MTGRESGIVRRSSPRWEVVFTYTTPDYSRRRGFDIPRRHRVGFIVQTISEEHALAAARSLFREATLQSGVSWVHVIESISCRQLDEEEHRG